MIPTFVHRYAFPTHEVIESLLGDAVGDCEAWRIRIEGDEVVVDVVAPTPGIAPSLEDVTSLASDEAAKINMAPHSATDGAGASPSPECSVARENTETQPAATPDRQEPEIKGGPLARRAAIACSERGFWTFLGVSSADEAKADVCRRCGVTTRKMLDHDSGAAAIWNDIDRKYGLWKEGYDIELDPVNSGDIGHE